MVRIRMKGRGITSGVAEGIAMVSDEPLGFSPGLDPLTGKIADNTHAWFGQSAKGKILIFPYGKGSSTGGIFILEATRLGNVPLAVVNLRTDPVVAGGFIIANIIYDKRIPVVDRFDEDPTKIIKTGDRVKVDGNNGTVEVC